MYRYQELTGCKEYYENYPNLPLWEHYYGPYGDEEREDYDEEEEESVD